VLAAGALRLCSAAGCADCFATLGLEELCRSAIAKVSGRALAGLCEVKEAFAMLCGPLGFDVLGCDALGSAAHDCDALDCVAHDCDALDCAGRGRAAIVDDSVRATDVVWDSADAFARVCVAFGCDALGCAGSGRAAIAGDSARGFASARRAARLAGG
jgi:hypothetical protein